MGRSKASPSPSPSPSPVQDRSSTGPMPGPWAGLGRAVHRHVSSGTRSVLSRRDWTFAPPRTSAVRKPPHLGHLPTSLTVTISDLNLTTNGT